MRRPTKSTAAAEAPRDFDGLRGLVLARAGDLPKKLAQVAAFALEHPDEVAFGTAASVAASAKAQPSTMVRLAQALGYSGYSDLQAVFRDRLREKVPGYADRLAALHAGKAAETGALLSAFAGAAIRSAQLLRERIDLEQLATAATVLTGARTLYLAGQRRSFPAVAYLSYVLAKLAVPHHLLASPAGIDAETLTLAGPEDALLAISFAPYAPGTLASVRVAHERGIPVVAITDSPFSPLVPSAAAWLEVIEADVEGFRIPSATFALAMTLAVSVAERRRVPLNRRRDR